jgi:hypothetical protein
MLDNSPSVAPQLCLCGHAPLRCALATLAEVENSLMTDPRGSPACCLTIARKETAVCGEVRRLAILTCAAVREILPALRDDRKGQAIAARCVANAAVALEKFIVLSERRTKAATALLRKKYGKDTCAACGDESGLRAATEQLRWCESRLGPSRLALDPSERTGVRRT